MMGITGRMQIQAASIRPVPDLSKWIFYGRISTPRGIFLTTKFARQSIRAILTLIPNASPVNPLSNIFPLVIVLGAGVTKDIWEDTKRQTSDKHANAVEVNVLRGNKFVPVSSCEVSVGDILMYRLGDEVLADSVVLNSSYADGVMYIETANLDGETNAKTRRAKPQTIEYLGNVDDVIHQCLPNGNLREHYMTYGTTLNWKETNANVPNSPPNTNKKPIGAPHSTGPAAAVSPGNNLPSGNSTLSPSPISPGYKRAPLSDTPPLPPRTSEAMLEKDRRLSRQSSAVRYSQTNGDDIRDVSSGAEHLSRQHTFDERFAIGSNIPLPSDLAQMSFVYEQRRQSGLPSQQRCPESMGGSMNRVEGVSRAETPTANIAKSEQTGAGSGVVLLAAPPRPELYSWIGQLRMPNGEIVPLGIEQFIPRGCVVRNTEWVLCAVVYVGRETKMLLGLKPRPRKTSVIGRRLNILNLFLLLLHQILGFMLCGMALRWRDEKLVPPEGTLSGHSTWYLQWYLSSISTGTFFAWRYIAFFIILGYFIPLSLYVSLEFNKAMQMLLLAYDRRMATFDDFSGKLRYSRPKTSELNCQLAHVQNIFTDKTGTLTENLMTYVGGCTTLSTHDERSYPGGLGGTFLQSVRQSQRERLGKNRVHSPTKSKGRVGVGEPKTDGSNVQYDFDEETMEADPTFQYLRALALCHTIVCFDRPVTEAEGMANAASEGNTQAAQDPISRNGSDLEMGSMPQVRANNELRERQPSGVFRANSSMTQLRTMSGVRSQLHGRTGSSGWYAARHNDIMAGSRGAMVPPEVEDLRDTSKIYEGQSLDEIALVAAARDNLFALYRRNAKLMFVKAIDKIMCYEIIAELEFTAQRKLMSILLFRNPEYDHLFSAEDLPLEPEQENHAAVSDVGPQQEASLDVSKGESGSQTQSKSSPAPQPERPTKVSALQLGDVGSSNEVPDEVSADSTSSSLSPVHPFESEERPYLLLVKGADTSMFPIINKQNPQNAQLLPNFQHELEVMARQGLRTLVLGQRYCTEREVREWLPNFNEALCTMQKRNEKLHEVYELMERDVDLIGTTAVEDRLQEGVPETLNFFLRSEIVVWMLTGDKRETAVTIAGTSGLVDKEFEEYVYHLDVTEAAGHYASTAAASAAPEVCQLIDSQIEAAKKLCDDSELQHGTTHLVVLVVDGQTLDIIFAEKERTKKFFHLGCRSRSAICCRMTPKQKADVVQLFQKNTKNIVLAVGDGANDVPMIQESHIGVGIMGLEGSQAELASDYAIPKFRFLKRLLVVHGRFSLYRECNCIVFSLYKNILLTTGLTAYAFFSGFSAITFVESWLLALFNLALSSLQPLAMGIVDKDVEDELAESLPQIYPALSREKMFFSWGYIGKFLVDALVDGLVIFFFIIYTVAQGDELYPWHSSSLDDYGMLFFIMILIMLNVRGAHLMTSYTVITGSVVISCFLFIPIVVLLYSLFLNIFGIDRSIVIAVDLLGTWKFWIFALFVLGVYVVYGLAAETFMALYFPWTNGRPAVTTAKRSPYRLEHHMRRRRFKEGEELPWDSVMTNRIV